MEKHIPLRQCVGCRTMQPKCNLVRIIRTKDGNIVYDSTGKVSGRGAYICKSVSCLDKAVKTGAFYRSLEVRIPEEVLEAVRNQVMLNG